MNDTGPFSDEIAEKAAQAVLGWTQGEGTAYEQAFRHFAQALVDELGVADLVEAKIELLAEYKLDYPQDFEPDDLERMKAEVARLRELRERLSRLRG